MSYPVVYERYYNGVLNRRYVHSQHSTHAKAFKAARSAAYYSARVLVSFVNVESDGYEIGRGSSMTLRWFTPRHAALDSLEYDGGH